MAGSHDVAGKQFCRKTARLNTVDLCQKGYLPNSDVHVGQTSTRRDFLESGRTAGRDEMRKLFLAVQVDKDGRETPAVSEFWMFLDDHMQDALTFIRNHAASAETVHSAVISGELFGGGIQDLTYR